MIERRDRIVGEITSICGSHRQSGSTRYRGCARDQCRPEPPLLDDRGLLYLCDRRRLDRHALLDFDRRRRRWLRRWCCCEARFVDLGVQIFEQSLDLGGFRCVRLLFEITLEEEDRVARAARVAVALSDVEEQRREWLRGVRCLEVCERLLELAQVVVSGRPLEGLLRGRGAIWIRCGGK